MGIWGSHILPLHCCLSGEISRYSRLSFPCNVMNYFRIHLQRGWELFWWWWDPDAGQRWKTNLFTGLSIIFSEKRQELTLLSAFTSYLTRSEETRDPENPEGKTETCAGKVTFIRYKILNTRKRLFPALWHCVTLRVDLSHLSISSDILWTVLCHQEHDHHGPREYQVSPPRHCEGEQLRTSSRVVSW